MDAYCGSVSKPKLSESLRDRTSALHRRAERSGILSDILHKKADRRSYAIFLRNLMPAYHEMEQRLDHLRGAPAFRIFARPELRRAECIRSDLAVLCGAEWERALPLLPAGARYASRVREAGTGGGLPLIAHAYVRYFGDLSGGQVVHRLLMSSLGLPSDALSFYVFPGIADPQAFKDEMRSVMDEEAESLDDPEIIVQEGLQAFAHNIEVSEAVRAFVSTAH